jgi:hypothetical protein
MILSLHFFIHVNLSEPLQAIIIALSLQDTGQFGTFIADLSDTAKCECRTWEQGCV